MSAIIKGNLITLINKHHDKEREVRFGMKRIQDKSGFIKTVNGIKYSTFEATKKSLTTTFGNPSIQEYSSVSYNLGTKASDEVIRRDIGMENETLTTITKQKISSTYIEEYQLTVNFSKETKYEGEIPPNLNSFTRHKKRFSWNINDMFLIDMTVVSGNTYEIELEIKTNNIETINEMIKVLLTFINETDKVYSVEKRNQMIDNFCSVTGIRKTNNGEVNIAGLSKVINFKANQFFSNLFDKELFITRKYDGRRSFLYISNEHMFLFSPPGTFNLLGYKSMKVGNVLTSIFPVVFEGELMEDNTFYPFAILNKNLSQNKQIDYINLLVDSKIEFTSINIKSKLFYRYLPQDDFYSVIKQIYDNDINIPTDGLIITEDITGVSYKWKPLEKLTIDFQIQDNKLYSLFVTENKEYKLVIPPFMEGREIVYDYDQTFIKKENLNKHIVEVLLEGNKAIIKKIRGDKVSPNYLDVANDIWEDINQPITLEVMKGEEFFVLFRWHNKIKEQIYKKINSPTSLFDIGAGRGGDIYKYPSSIERFFFLEPNEEFLKELTRRLVDFKKPYTIFNDTLDKYEVTDTTFSLVVSMLSLTYFFKSKELFEDLIFKLINLVDIGGYFAFLTFDGNKLESMFQQKYYTRGNHIALKNISYIVPENITSVGEFGRECKISISSSHTVKEQTEYVADVDLLSAYLLENGFEKLYLEDVPTTRMLNKEEIIFNQLFTWGIYKRSS